METFHALARRSNKPLIQPGIEIWLVDEEDLVIHDVQEEKPAGEEPSKSPPRNSLAQLWAKTRVA